MSLVDELKKLFPFVPEEVIGSLVLFVASLIAFGIGAMIIWFLPSDERMPYGNTFKLLIAITITAPVLIASVFFMDDMIEYRVKRHEKKKT